MITTLKNVQFAIIVLVIVGNGLIISGDAVAKINKSPPTSLVVDLASGKILHFKNHKKKIFPASLTKIMTLYLTFDALKSGKLSLGQKLPVSKYATRVLPSKLHLKHEEYITVKNAILALIIKSANDAARVIAENIAGSEKKFARLMTIRARQLGMNHTTFTNASGWHDDKQVTTAVDLAKLSIAIRRDFAEYYHFFQETSFKFRGRTVRPGNSRSHVTSKYKGAEGLKTGFHTPAGYNLIIIATRNEKSLVGIVTGGRDISSRDKEMVKLLDKHFGVKSKKLPA